VQLAGKFALHFPERRDSDSRTGAIRLPKRVVPGPRERLVRSPGTTRQVLRNDSAGQPRLRGNVRKFPTFQMLQGFWRAATAEPRRHSSDSDSVLRLLINRYRCSDILFHLRQEFIPCRIHRLRLERRLAPQRPPPDSPLNGPPPKSPRLSFIHVHECSSTSKAGNAISRGRDDVGSCRAKLPLGRYLTEVERRALVQASELASPPGIALEVGCDGGRWSILLRQLGWSNVLY
jgi:hypothetical protein